jgi:hypothetical protein
MSTLTYKLKPKYPCFLSPPNIKQTFNLHHVDYLILTKLYHIFGYSPYTTSYPNLNIKQRLALLKNLHIITSY